MKRRPRRTAGEALAAAIEALRPTSLTPRLDAEVLLAHAMHRSRTYILAHPEEKLFLSQQDGFDSLVRRRAREVPLAYLTGECEFYGLRFHVSVSVLIPRPETEHLVEAALDWAKGRPALHIVDVGTGSGAIAVALAKHLPDAHITAIDVKKRILRLARVNAETNGVADRIIFIVDDLLSWNCEPADLIAANLPYVPTAHLNRMPPHEPRAALDGGKDGLGKIRRLLAQAPCMMKDESLLLLEIGFGQAETVSGLARKAVPGAQISVLHDYAGLPRVVRVEKA